MRVELEGVTELRFADGQPVRAASAIAPFGDGWLVVQDDATHAAWCRPAGVVPVRVVDAVGGHETFSAAAGTKHLKPDFEAACAVAADAVLLFGSGSTAARTRVSLVTPTGYTVADVAPVYAAVAAALRVPAEGLNLEGACRIGDRLRWFQRGDAAAGVPSASVELDLSALLAVATGRLAPGAVTVRDMRRHHLGAVAGVALAVTDAVALPDGRVVVSAAAEDTPNAYDDGPVIGAALALLDDAGVRAVTPLPPVAGAPAKVEGLAVREATADGVRLVAVVDADDPAVPSQQLALRLWC